MGSWKTIFIVAVIHALCSWHHAHAEIKPIEYEPSGGGGECDTDLDCNLKGMCMNEDAKDGDASKGDDDEINGKCVCDTGRDGKNCEKEDKKVRKRDVIHGVRRSKHHLVKRQLMSDPKLQATGLDPEECATNKISLLINNMRSSRYVRVSSDSPKTGSEKNNKYLVTDNNNLGADKLFQLEKTGDQYFILARDDDDTKTVGYIYFSKIMKGVRKKSNRIMMSAKKGDGDEYKFTFVKNPVQNGVYKIKSNGMTLYGSIGGHNVKADKRTDREKSEEIWFQLNLRANMDITTKVTDTRVNVLKRGDDLEVAHEEYDNGNSEDLKVTLDKTEVISRAVTNFNKATASGTGGFKAPFANIGVTVSGETSETDQSTLSKTGKANIEIPIKGKSKLCVEYTINVGKQFDEDELEITSKGKKYKGYQLKVGKNKGAVALKLRKIGMGENCK